MTVRHLITAAIHSIGPSATIRGKGLRMVNRVSNIAIRNLTITNINPQIVWGGDALSNGAAFVPLGSTVAGTNAACQAALGRSCAANIATPQVGTFPLAQSVLNAFAAAPSGAVVSAYPAAEVPNVVPHLAGPGHM